MAVWGGFGVETNFWLISWDRLERKKSGSVGGIRVEITVRLISWIDQRERRVAVWIGY